MNKVLQFVGEGVDDSMSIKTWMEKNTTSKQLSDDTYHKLSQNGFNTIKDLKDVTLDEMKEYLKQMQIQLSDQSPLKRAVEILGNKQRFVDPEEIKVMKSMQLKIKQFENSMNHESAKQESISKQAKEIQTQIDLAFDQIMQKLSARKAAISARLVHIKEKKIAQIKSRIDAYNASMKGLNQIKQENNALMNQPIDIHELDARKAKILDNQQKMMQIIEKTMKQNQPTISYKICALLDTANMIELINTFGNISDVCLPVLVQLKYDNDANGEVLVSWKLDDEEKENTANSGKLSIEYGILSVNEHDEKQDEAARQQLVKTEIAIENRRSGTEKVEIDSIGTYLFKLKYFDNVHKVWSPYSNTKTIHIQQIAPLPSIDSSILTDDEKRTLLAFVKQRLGDHKYQFALLLRSSRDGATIAQFHQLCDNKGATFIIAKSKKYNHVFGGYTSSPWSTSASWHKDESAFLFLLRSSFGHSPKLIKIKSGPYMVYSGYISYGPLFGNTAIRIFESNDQTCYSEIHPEYVDDVKGNALCGGDSYNETNQRYDFELDDFGVFSVI